MNLKNKWSAEVVSLPRAIEMELRDSTDYYAGELETMQSRLETTIRLLTEVLANLPPETVAKVLASNWELP